MPDFKNRNDIEFAKYDAMSTEELQALLREDASKPEGEETNMEVLFYVMEVLAKRRQARQEGKTPEEALESFVKNYMPEAETASSSESGSTVRMRKPMTRRWARGLVAAAAVLALIFGSSFTASAFGFDLWDFVVNWTQETFHFGNTDQESKISDPEKSDVAPYLGLQNALENLKIDTALAPTWLPEGYEEVEVRVQETPKQRQIIAKYEYSENEVKILITDYLNSSPNQIEQIDSTLEVYESEGIMYYIFTDVDTLQAAWVNGNYECYISGPLSTSEMKNIIDSIGKG